jgi:hypothetical protein
MTKSRSGPYLSAEERIRQGLYAASGFRHPTTFVIVSGKTHFVGNIDCGLAGRAYPPAKRSQGPARCSDLTRSARGHGVARSAT